MARTKERAALRGGRETRRALYAAIGALGEALAFEDAAALAAALPARFARCLVRSDSVEVKDIETFYAEVQRLEGTTLGRAVEHAQAVLDSLAGLLPPELLALLRSRLPREMASLLVPVDRASLDSPAFPHTHVAHEAPVRQTLSRGRPGASNRLADVHQPLGHAGSVARSASPHAEHLVETARSSRPAHEDETLATLRPKETSK